jgi:hypothetical protein
LRAGSRYVDLIVGRELWVVGSAARAKTQHAGDGDVRKTAVVLSYVTIAPMQE